MTKKFKKELEKTTGQELIEQRNFCSIYGYCDEYRDTINAEMLKRFNCLKDLEKEIKILRQAALDWKESCHKAWKEYEKLNKGVTMTDEEMANESLISYKKEPKWAGKIFMQDENTCYKEGFLAGLKTGRPQWHKIADGDLPKGDECYGETSIHRKIYLKDRDGNLYSGRYYPKDECHPEDCFAVEFLDWGLQGTHFCAKEQISEWCEVHTFTEDAN